MTKEWADARLGSFRARLEEAEDDASGCEEREGIMRQYIKDLQDAHFEGRMLVACQRTHLEGKDTQLLQLENRLTAALASAAHWKAQAKAKESRGKILEVKYKLERGLMKHTRSKLKWVTRYAKRTMEMWVRAENDGQLSTNAMRQLIKRIHAAQRGTAWTPGTTSTKPEARLALIPLLSRYGWTVRTLDEQIAQENPAIMAPGVVLPDNAPGVSTQIGDSGDGGATTDDEMEGTAHSSDAEVEEETEAKDPTRTMQSGRKSTWAPRSWNT
jgi:hypothetical protein